MKFLLLVAVHLLLGSHLHAQILLIPDNTIAYDNYEKKCHADGYLCTQKYFYNQVVAKPTPFFDSFMEALDISNKEFMNSAVKNIQNLLLQEMISASQLEMLERLLEQLQGANLNQANQLLKEVKFIQLELQKGKSNEGLEEKFIVYFKTAVPISRFLKMKKSYLNIPYTEIAFNAVPSNNNFKNMESHSASPLVEGVCENARLTNDADFASWKIMSNASCGWTKNISESAASTATTLNNNKGWLLVGALTLGAVMLANHYEVQFQF